MQKKCTKKSTKKRLSFILCMVLTVAMALCTAGCNGNNKESGSALSSSEAGQQEDNTGEDSAKETGQQEDAGADEDSTEAADAGNDNVLGEGDTQFDFTVVDKDGKETMFEIHTDKATVGEALQELELIDGEEGDYGLYVETVNGITADYEEDGTYWAFYINGEYAQSGVDVTEITEGERYSFKVE